MKSKRDHAIVIGAGIAGLLSARVLSKHFQHVTVIDKDTFPENSVPRSGAPQAVHLHVLLKRGLMIVEKLFPGIQEDLFAQGAIAVDWGRDAYWMNPVGWLPRFESGIVTCSCSRWMLEHTIHQKVFSIANVQLCPQSQVTDLQCNQHHEICGISSVKDGVVTSMDADLVVDTSGKHSKIVKILQNHGYPAPPESKVNAYLGYASQHYQIPQNLSDDWKQLYIQINPPHHCRGGVLYPIEGNRWIATLIGGNKDYPPGDQKGFLDFAKSLRSPEFYEAIRDAEPLSKVYCYRNTESRLRHYHKMKKIPAGLVSLGDSTCAFNPVYGQGMTVSALAAQTLDRCLANSSTNRRQFTLNFYRALRRIHFAPWLIATSEDNRIATNPDQKIALHYRMIHRFLDRILDAATKDPEVQRAFLQILHMLKPLSSLATPHILFSLRKKS